MSTDSRSSIIKNSPLIFVDIETTGGSITHGRIIEIAAIKVIDGKIIDTLSYLINPGQSIPPWITKLTGISNVSVVSAPYFDEVADEIFSFLNHGIFVAHNVLFDYSFIRNELKLSGHANFTPKIFCTVKLSRALYEVKGHSLEKIIQRHAIKVDDRHRAYSDAKAIVDFFQLAIKDHGSDAVEQNILQQMRTKSLPPNVDSVIIDSLPESHGVYIFEDDEGLPLYIGKSVNIKHRVKSHFTNATSVAKELKMTLRSHNVRYIETQTEIEALILESAKIKELQPLLNKKLRRAKTQALLKKSISANGYMTIGISNGNLAKYENMNEVYGVYATRRQAQKALESIVRTYQLCPVLMGLEKSKGSCFRFQLGLCRGACIGREDVERYNSRVEFALERSKIEVWPFPSSIEVELTPQRTMIVDQWVVTHIKDYSQDGNIQSVEGSFDVDTYKILRSYLKKKPKIRLVSDTQF